MVAILRRSLCALVILACLINAEPQCRFTIARLKYDGGGDWYTDPSSLPNLIRAVRAQTPILICDTPAVTEIMAEDFFHYPFVYMTGHGNVHFSPQERVRVRTFLNAGGFIWADDCYGMDTSFRREIKTLFPDNALTTVPVTHPIFSSVNKLAGVPKIHEHDGAPAQAMGVFLEKRLVILYTYSTDIGDGMEDLDVHKDGPRLHDLALRMGVNIVSWFINP